MKRIWLVALIGLAACNVTAPPRIIAETPASISYECIGTLGGCQATPQDIANSAQEHCRRYGKNAQQTQMGVAPSGNLRASFVCV